MWKNVLQNNNKFIRCFHEFFSVWVVEKEKNLIGPKQVFSISLPVENENILSSINQKKSWIRNSRLVKPPDEFVINLFYKENR